MRTITGTEFVTAEVYGNHISSAGAAGYWLDCTCPEAHAVSAQRQNILDATRNLASLLGYDLVLRQPATAERAA